MPLQLTILLVDDDTGHRTMLQTLLGQWGYGVTGACDGEQAVALCRERSFDLVLMDVRMPKKNGLEALGEIKAYNPALPVLMMTAFSDVEAAVATLKAGAQDFLMKPLDFAKLQSCLQGVFAASGLLPEEGTMRGTAQGDLKGVSIIGQSPRMREVLELVQTLAPSDATVLIQGESGTGKEVIAKALHHNSPRAGGGYVAVNCAAITESLLESELFGHEKGAFTGADKRHEGYFLRADKGTIFLDEVGEMPLAMQAKLLRVLQEREVLPVGGTRPVPVDVRIVTATNRDLQEAIARGNFREDLYYRLNVITLSLPPLRERGEDVPLLCDYFMNRFAERNRKNVKGFTPGAMDALIRYPWPGNVRELENTMERAVVLLVGEHISERELPDRVRDHKGGPAGNGNTLGHPSGFPAGSLSGQVAGNLAGQPYGSPAGSPALQSGDTEPQTLEAMEREAILATLEKVEGNRSLAAKILGITRKTLYSKLLKYNIDSNE